MAEPELTRRSGDGTSIDCVHLFRLLQTAVRAVSLLSKQSIWREAMARAPATPEEVAWPTSGSRPGTANSKFEALDRVHSPHPPRRKDVGAIAVRGEIDGQRG
jgi:hypothetical protein